GLLQAAGRPATALVPDAGDHDVIMVTGRPSTVVSIRQATGARVLGATGGCAVLVGDDTDAVRATAEILRKHDHPESCTRLGGWWVRDGDSWRDRRGDPSDPARPHPSVIYRLGDDLDRPPREHAGYTVLPCDRTGVVGTLVGFARDPLHGWPGDFRV
ncbi:hypothetical protein ACFQ08_07625, partial [Streptosporangium algeriense]